MGKKGGVVTAGGASGICDGAAAVMMASEEAVKEHNLTPLARIVGYGVAGCEPTIMGICGTGAFLPESPRHPPGEVQHLWRGSCPWPSPRRIGLSDLSSPGSQT